MKNAVFWPSVHGYISNYCKPLVLQRIGDISISVQYAMTGYGVAFPRGSKYVAPFNEKLLEYIENGKRWKWKSQFAYCIYQFTYWMCSRRRGSITAVLVNRSLQTLQGGAPVFRTAFHRAISFRLLVASIRYRIGLSSARSRACLFPFHTTPSDLTDHWGLLFPHFHCKSISILPFLFDAHLNWFLG